MQRGPLAGVTVIDFTSYIAGPFAGSLLADLGAEVIKVESPEGDMMRYYPSTIPEEGRTFLGVNRGKRSIVVNLKSEEGKQVIRRLVSGADVVLENFRPSVPRRLGLDYDALKQINPRLIYCALTGFGDRGPMRENAGYDQVLQAMAGIAVFQGESVGTAPRTVPGSIVDYYAAAMTALGAVAALHQRALTGEGQYVGASLLSATLAMQAGRFVWTETEPRDVDRELRPGKLAAVHPTREGYIYISAHTQEFWRSLCAVLDLPALAEDERYDNIRKRAEHADVLLPQLHAALARHTAVEWEILMAGKVPCALVRPIEDAFDHPQVLAEGLVSSYPHAALGSYRGLAAPIQFSASAPVIPTGAPVLGEQTDQILAERGWSADDIARLRACGAVA